MVPETLWRWAQTKGVTVLGTGDFTHPAWYAELLDKLEPAGNGLFTLKTSLQDTESVTPILRSDTFFVLSAEISSIYRKYGKTRKVHSLVLVHDFTDAARISLALSRIGNLKSDGRPILGLDAKELLRIVLDESPSAFFIPAHIWTPYFSVFGAESGFDSLEECFEDLTPHVYAVETGLSSNPPMNRRVSALDSLTLVSNSDAHSPGKVGREANIFDTSLSYDAITESLRTRRGFSGTVEFFPEEGKYHYDGHRLCRVSLTPQETIRCGYQCPVCGRKLTVGVLHRVERLSDRSSGEIPVDATPYFSLIPLQEIIAEALGKGVATKAVVEKYQNMIRTLGNEFTILMKTPVREISRSASDVVGEAIRRMRTGEISVTPGYDGLYGKIRIFEEGEISLRRGKSLLL